jgi:hypothetical protein
LAKKPNSTNNSTVDSSGSPSSAPDSVSAHFGFADDRCLDQLVDEAGDDQQGGAQQEVIEHRCQTPAQANGGKSPWG